VLTTSDGSPDAAVGAAAAGEYAPPPTPMTRRRREALRYARATLARRSGGACDGAATAPSWRCSSATKECAHACDVYL